MSKFISTSSHDAKLEKIRTATETHICTGDPSNRSQVLAQSIGTYTPTFSAVANGAGNVRRTTTLQQQTNVPITGDGTAAHLCSIDATELLEKTEITPNVALTNGQSVTANAHDINSTEAT